MTTDDMIPWDGTPPERGEGLYVAKSTGLPLFLWWHNGDWWMADVVRLDRPVTDMVQAYHPTPIDPADVPGLLRSQRESSDLLAANLKLHVEKLSAESQRDELARRLRERATAGGHTDHVVLAILDDVLGQGEPAVIPPSADFAETCKLFAAEGGAYDDDDDDPAPTLTAEDRSDPAVWCWRCDDCGEPAEMTGWRWTGERWEHSHGYPAGHVSATCFGRWLEFPPTESGEARDVAPTSWACPCGASGTEDPGPEWCPECGAGEDGVPRPDGPPDPLDAAVEAVVKAIDLRWNGPDAEAVAEVRESGLAAIRAALAPHWPGGAS